MSETNDNLVSFELFRLKKEADVPIDDKKTFDLEVSADDLNNLRSLLVYEQGLNKPEVDSSNLIDRFTKVIPDEVMIYGSSPFSFNETAVQIAISYEDFRSLTRVVRWYPTGEEMVQKYKSPRGHEFGLDMDRLKYESAYINLARALFNKIISEENQK